MSATRTYLSSAAEGETGLLGWRFDVHDFDYGLLLNAR